MSKKDELLPSAPRQGHKQSIADASGYNLRPQSAPLSLPVWPPVPVEGGVRPPLAEPSALLGNVPENTLLTQLIRAIAPREKGVEGLVQTLLWRFRSVAGVMNAPYHELESILGKGAVLGVYFQIVNDAARRMHLARLKIGSTLADRAQLIAYLQTVLGHEVIEQVRVLFLDSTYHLLADEVTGRGTIDHAPVYPREVIRRALALQAHYLVLVHNHPSGDPSPSPQDIDMTHHIAQAAKVMGLTVWDHVILGGGRMVSLREAGFL